MSNVYPITTEFKRLVSELDLKSELAETAAYMEELIGEYEHGVAEPSDLLPVDAYTVLNKAFDTTRAEEIHGTNSECPAVQTGTALRCPGHRTKTLDDVSLEIMKSMFFDLLQYMNSTKE